MDRARDLREIFTLLAWTAAAVLLNACASDAGVGADAGGLRDAAALPQPASECDGAFERPLVGLAFDAELGCFGAPELFAGACISSEDAEGALSGSGEFLCITRPERGPVYAFLDYGEELSDPDWHHSVSDAYAPTLTEEEEQACDTLFAAVERSDILGEEGRSLAGGRTLTLCFH